MMITIDLRPDMAEALTRKAAQEGSDVAGYVRQLAVRDSDGRGFDGHTLGQENLAPRTPGLHAGWYWIAPDFDAPLPDSFWLGADDESRL